jgi:two-component system phosphate regulon sensor histidine kinase PhoR
MLLGAEETAVLRNAGLTITAFQAALESLWHAPSGAPILTINEVALHTAGRSLRAQVTRLPAPEDDQALIVLQDLTDLRRAEQSRRLLMSNIAHVLRTPLASLQAIIETLQDGATLSHATLGGRPSGW